MVNRLKKLTRSQKIYFAILALTALGLGLSHGVISNYFKDAYNVTPVQRGLIEFPRELPGVLVLLIIASLSAFSDIRITMIAQGFSIVGIVLLGIFTPPFTIMLIFIFVNSMGMHMSMPLRDSIGLDLAENKNLGKVMGQYKGVFTGFSMISSLIVFIGFRYDFFSFTAKIKWIFVISAIIVKRQLKQNKFKN